MQLYQDYKLRFQIKFICRNARQFTRLEDCQARDVLKLEFHFSASLTALNQHLLERFILNLDLEPNQIKSHPSYSSLCNYGVIAA